jgi:uncharacterized membrane protein YfcA
LAYVRTWLWVTLVVFACAFCLFWWQKLRGEPRPVRPRLRELAVGFVTDFLDTLGVGSFATTTSLFRALKLMPDRELPGTLNVGHALPTVLQAVLYIAVIDVDSVTLCALIGAAMGGAYVGAGWVARWSTRSVQLCVACALVLALLLMCLSMQGLLPGGGSELALHGPRLFIGVLGNFILGALMTFGIGLYAPCMLLVSLLGMNPKAAFPIMMGSCAFLMLIAAPRFVQRTSYAPRAALGLTLGGLPAVWLAANIVRELPLTALRWLVLLVVGYTAISLFVASRTRK